MQKVNGFYIKKNFSGGQKGWSVLVTIGYEIGSEFEASQVAFFKTKKEAAEFSEAQKNGNSN
jgi:hypothetical protein